MCKWINILVLLGIVLQMYLWCTACTKMQFCSWSDTLAVTEGSIICKRANVMCDCEFDTVSICALSCSSQKLKSINVLISLGWQGCSCLAVCGTLHERKHAQREPRNSHGKRCLTFGLVWEWFAGEVSIGKIVLRISMIWNLYEQFLKMKRGKEIYMGAFECQVRQV